MRIAKADLVPTDTNLRDDYEAWAELRATTPYGALTGSDIRLAGDRR